MAKRIIFVMIKLNIMAATANTIKFAMLAIFICSATYNCSAQKKNKRSEKRTLTFRLPDGYIGRGTEGDYVVYSDSVHKHNGRNVSTIRSDSREGLDFATILTYLKPEKSLGKRVKYTAYVRSENVQSWAGLWMRVDPVDPHSERSLAFDNMSQRPIKGTTQWTKYEIVLDISKNADNIVYGALLAGEGQIWIDSMDVQIVDNDVPVTDMVPHPNKKKL
jgi:hypothetical protein